jgi:predicted transcriptional regulator
MAENKDVNRMLKKRVLKIINDNDSITISELADKLKLNRVFLSGYLQALEENGELSSKNIGTAKVFRINKINKEMMKK